MAGLKQYNAAQILELDPIATPVNIIDESNPGLRATWDRMAREVRAEDISSWVHHAEIFAIAMSLKDVIGVSTPKAF